MALEDDLLASKASVAKMAKELETINPVLSRAVLEVFDAFSGWILREKHSGTPTYELTSSLVEIVAMAFVDVAMRSKVPNAELGDFANYRLKDLAERMTVYFNRLAAETEDSMLYVEKRDDTRNDR